VSVLLVRNVLRRARVIDVVAADVVEHDVVDRRIAANQPFRNVAISIDVFRIDEVKHRKVDRIARCVADIEITQNRIARPSSWRGNRPRRDVLAVDVEVVHLVRVGQHDGVADRGHDHRPRRVGRTRRRFRNDDDAVLLRGDRVLDAFAFAQQSLIIL
jgi:hypothetical protein